MVYVPIGQRYPRSAQGDRNRHRSGPGNVKAAKAAAEAAEAGLQFTKIAIEQNIKIAGEAAEAAKQSAKAAELALNAERPFLFVEGQKISNYLRFDSRSILITPSELDVSLEPQRYKGTSKADAISVRLEFDIRNRGKGVAVIRGVRTRMLVGRGAFENTDAPLLTIGQSSGTIQLGVSVVGPGESAHCFATGGSDLSLDIFSDVTDSSRSLRFAVLISYADVYGRRFSNTLGFGYRPPMRDLDDKVIVGPALLPIFRRYRRPEG